MVRWASHLNRCALLLAISLSPLAHARAQALPAAAAAPRPTEAALFTPPAPVPPAVAIRDAEGRVTIRAIRLSEGLRVDGRLDEAIYQLIPAIGGFEQIEPNAGEPATEKTDVWIFFDREFVYVSVRCWDSAPEERWVVNGIVRDSSSIPRSENIAFFFDTFYSRRNASVFEINADGGIWDGEITNERFSGSSWNPVWSYREGRFDGGWTAETAIPFKSLRYRPGTSQVWGFQIRRTIRHKNEETFLARPRLLGTRGDTALSQVSNGATIVGLEVPPGSKNLDIKPYALSSVKKDAAARPNEPAGSVGLDVKYGVTQNLTADLTYNTDFAQVEVDTQQVNLTRFSLFYPEKREFFLEGQGMFDFGGATSGGLTPMLFFSRRIGLDAGRVVPIDGGGRLTGKVGKVTLGLMNVQSAAGGTRDAPIAATNFTVMRVKRDFLRRSSVGALYTRRSISTLGHGAGETFGLDAALGLYDHVTVNTYVAKTRTPGLSGDDTSYRFRFDYASDRYGLVFERLTVGDHFNPDMGYVERDDFQGAGGGFRFSPRPRSSTRVRKFTYSGEYKYLTDGTGRLETRSVEGVFDVEFHNSDRLSAQYQSSYEFLERPFSVGGVSIPAGGYGFRDALVSMFLGTQRRFTGTVTLQSGGYYSGEKTSLGFSSGRLQVTPRLSLEPGASMNWVNLREGEFTQMVVSNRTTYTATPRMFFSGLLQYGSAARSLSANLRLRWEYRPGSELFAVYTDERDTRARGYPDLKNRAFVVKINRLFRL